MLTGLAFLICQILIIGPSLLIVGILVIMEWLRQWDRKPRGKSTALIALTIALVPDFILFVNLLTGERLIPVVSADNNAPLFSEWQIISGVLIVLALCLSFFKRDELKKATLRGSLILFLIHGAGTLLFFSDDLLSWLKSM